MRHTHPFPARLCTMAVAAALLATPIARGGFPVTDFVAAAQRVLDQVEQRIISAQSVQQTARLVEQVGRIRAQIQQDRDAAEGLIGRVTGWGRMVASTAGMLGSPGDVGVWLQSAQDLSERARRIQAGSEAAPPAPAAARAVWARLPDFPPLGGTPPPPPTISRAEHAEQRAQSIADMSGRLDALLTRQAEALERNAQALEQARQATEETKGNTETGTTALQQKQQALTGTIADLLAAQEQREALREERALAELAERRTALARLETQVLIGIERVVAEAADLQARYDAAGADRALSRAVLPAY